MPMHKKNKLRVAPLILPVYSGCAGPTSTGAFPHCLCFLTTSLVLYILRWCSLSEQGGIKHTTLPARPLANASRWWECPGWYVESREAFGLWVTGYVGPAAPGPQNTGRITGSTTIALLDFFSLEKSTSRYFQLLLYENSSWWCRVSFPLL